MFPGDIVCVSEKHASREASLSVIGYDPGKARNLLRMWAEAQTDETRGAIVRSLLARPEVSPEQLWLVLCEAQSSKGPARDWSRTFALELPADALPELFADPPAPVHSGAGYRPSDRRSP